MSTVLKQMTPVKYEIEGLDGVTFYITPFGAFVAARLTADIASVLSPILGMIAPLFSSGKSEEDIMHEDVADLVKEIQFGSIDLDGAKVEALARELLVAHRNVAYEIVDDDGEARKGRLDDDMVNALFSGNVQYLFFLMFKVIGVNYGGFFGNAGSLFGTANGEQTKKTTLADTATLTQTNSQN